MISAVAISVFYMSPILTLFFSYLGALQIANWKKVCIDQFIFAPVYTCGVISLKLFVNTTTPAGSIPFEVQ